MKKLFALAVAAVISTSVFAQGPMAKYLEGRFGGPEKHVFIEKGSHAIGIKGSFRSFNVSGDDATNAGYALVSLLNIGDGSLKIWNVDPSFHMFLADDLSLGVSLHYMGYSVNTDLRLDLRDIINSTSENLNFSFSNRSIAHHAGGVSIALRRYVPFFGSKMLAVFGEGRLQGTYGVTTNAPRDREGKDYNRDRLNQAFSVALKIAGGACIKLPDNSAITVSVPLFGLAYNNTVQNKTTTSIVSEPDPNDPSKNIEKETTIKSRTRMSSFNAARNIDFLGIQIGYTRFIQPKKRK